MGGDPARVAAGCFAWISFHVDAGGSGKRMGLMMAPATDWCFIAEQPAPAPHLAYPEGCAALRIVLFTVSCVSRSCENFPDGWRQRRTRGAPAFRCRLLQPCDCLPRCFVLSLSTLHRLGSPAFIYKLLGEQGRVSREGIIERDRRDGPQVRNRTTQTRFREERGGRREEGGERKEEGRGRREEGEGRVEGRGWGRREEGGEQTVWSVPDRVS